MRDISGLAFLVAGMIEADSMDQQLLEQIKYTDQNAYRVYGKLIAVISNLSDDAETSYDVWHEVISRWLGARLQ